MEEQLKSEQNIIENNMFLAKFLGGTIEKWYHNQTSGHTEYLWKGKIANTWRVEKLKKEGVNIVAGDLNFHKSWDWLLPIWEKVLTISNKIPPHDTTIVQLNALAISKAILPCNINDAYKTLVELVKFLSLKVEINNNSILTPKIEFITGPVIQIQFPVFY